MLNSRTQVGFWGELVGGSKDLEKKRNEVLLGFMCFMKPAIFCLWWKVLTCWTEESSLFDLENMHSQPSRSSSPRPLTYVARNLSWQRWLCAWLWKPLISDLYRRSFVCFLSGLEAMVEPNLQPTSYLPPSLIQNTTSNSSAMASPYLNLFPH